MLGRRPRLASVLRKLCHPLASNSMDWVHLRTQCPAGGELRAHNQVSTSSSNPLFLGRISFVSRWSALAVSILRIDALGRYIEWLPSRYFPDTSSHAEKIAVWLLRLCTLSPLIPFTMSGCLVCCSYFVFPFFVEHTNKSSTVSTEILLIYLEKLCCLSHPSMLVRIK